jgi:hypothetical protein
LPDRIAAPAGDVGRRRGTECQRHEASGDRLSCQRYTLVAVVALVFRAIGVDVLVMTFVFR